MAYDWLREEFGIIDDPYYCPYCGTECKTGQCKCGHLKLEEIKAH